MKHQRVGLNTWITRSELQQKHFKELKCLRNLPTFSNFGDVWYIIELNYTVVLQSSLEIKVVFFCRGNMSVSISACMWQLDVANYEYACIYIVDVRVHLKIQYLYALYPSTRKQETANQSFKKRLYHYSPYRTSGSACCLV